MTHIQIKRNSNTGAVPNTTTLGVGELAVNLTDHRLFVSNGTAVYDIVANVQSSFTIANTLFIGNGSSQSSNTFIPNNTISHTIDSFTVGIGNVVAATYTVLASNGSVGRLDIFRVIANSISVTLIAENTANLGTFAVQTYTANVSGGIWSVNVAPTSNTFTFKLIKTVLIR